MEFHSPAGSVLKPCGINKVIPRQTKSRERRELKTLVHRLGGCVSPRDVMQHCKKYRTADDAIAALQTLVDAAEGSFEMQRSSSGLGRQAYVLRSRTLLIFQSLSASTETQFKIPTGKPQFRFRLPLQRGSHERNRHHHFRDHGQRRDTARCSCASSAQLVCRLQAPRDQHQRIHLVRCARWRRRTVFPNLVRRTFRCTGF